MHISEFFEACEKASNELKIAGRQLRFNVEIYKSDLGLIDRYNCYSYKFFETRYETLIREIKDKEFLDNFLKHTQDKLGGDSKSIVMLWSEKDSEDNLFSVYINIEIVCI